MTSNQGNLLREPVIEPVEGFCGLFRGASAVASAGNREASKHDNLSRKLAIGPVESF